MKTILLASFLFLLLNSCSSKKEMNRNVEFTITDKYIVDNSLINLNISNKTASNYYLPIINLDEGEKWRYILSSDQRRFFFIFKVGHNYAADERNWFSIDCLAEIDKELEMIDELWKKKKKTITTKDLILLKSGESIKIKVPMNLYIKISKYCNWELEGYKSEKLDIGINYPKKEKELATKFLSRKTLDSLKQMGYELYDKEINSNKVSLILK
jgi:hypothetical protein